MSLIAYNIHGSGHAGAAKQLIKLLETELGDVVGSAQTLTLPGASYTILHVYPRSNLSWFKRWVGRLRIRLVVNANMVGFKVERIC